MKTTVVVSCYKQEKYVAACLDSILDQKTECDFDILIADDCSPDNTASIIRQYQAAYPDKIKSILRKKNIGAAKNYIDAHKNATGDIVFHMDGDDVMLPGKMQKQWTIFMTQPDVNLIFHQAEYFSDDEAYKSLTGLLRGKPGDIWYFDAFDLAQWGSITVHSAYAYRKSARKTDDPGREFMEWFFAMDALLPSGKAAFINDVLVRYRCNPSGESYLDTKAGRLKAYQIYFKDIDSYWHKNPILRKQLYANALVSFLGMIKNHQPIVKSNILMLLKYCYYVNPLLIIKTLKIRKNAAPDLLIR